MFDNMCFFIYNTIIMDEEFKQIAMNGVFNESDEVLLPIFDVHFKDNLNNINLKLKNGGVVCFTGNRPASLPWKFNEDCELCKEFKSLVNEDTDTSIIKGYKQQVKVIKAILSISTPSSITRFSTFLAISSVLPVPALAKTYAG